MAKNNNSPIRCCDGLVEDCLVHANAGREAGSGQHESWRPRVRAELSALSEFVDISRVGEEDGGISIRFRTPMSVKAVRLHKTPA